MTAPDPAELLPRLRELARDELREQADRGEAASAFPRDLLTELGRLGVLGLPPIGDPARGRDGQRLRCVVTGVDVSRSGSVW
jgi:alkylation response protein AidB-like acyl-CoA dehydrogenase